MEKLGGAEVEWFGGRCGEGSTPPVAERYPRQRRCLGYLRGGERVVATSYDAELPGYVALPRILKFALRCRTRDRQGEKDQTAQWGFDAVQ